jgi:hypothetical protein
MSRPKLPVLVASSLLAAPCWGQTQASTQAPSSPQSQDPNQKIQPATQGAPLPPQVPLNQAAGLPNPQGTVFQTPGMPNMGIRISSGMGQVTRFSNEFNPAFSFIIDATAEAVDSDGGDDGLDAGLRSFEFTGNAWIDPNAWAYFIGVVEDESLELEEAAIHYIGLGDRHTLRAGRFFIDFGKQMQIHVHELRTLERPLALRTFLGAEVKGEGLQWDSWTTAGDSTAVRWSLGAFSSALAEVDEDDLTSSTATVETLIPGSGEDLTYTARVTGFTDVGERGTFQLGASARLLPRFEFASEDAGAVGGDLSNSVFGLDATYGWVGATGIDSWSIGAELLLNSGDTGAEFTGLDPTDPNDYTIVDESLFGWFGWVDYAWNRFNAVGLQFSQVELPDVASSKASEIEAYYTHMFSEFHRLRFVLAHTDSDLDGDTSRFVVQYTAVLGAHGHGVNW